MSLSPSKETCTKQVVAGNSATESTLTGNQRRMKADAKSIEHDQRGALLDDEEEGVDTAKEMRRELKLGQPR